MNEKFVGIDIGTDRVQVASFSPDWQTNNPIANWESQFRFSLPIDPQDPAPSDWVQVVADRLSDRLPRLVDQQQVNAFVSLPAGWTMFQCVAPDDLEATRCNCSAIFESSLFQSPASLTHWPANSKGNRHQVAAVASSAATQIAVAIANVGYRVKSIVPQIVAVLQAAEASASIKPAAVIQIEASHATLAIATPDGCGMCRQINAPDFAMKHSVYDTAYSDETLTIGDLTPWLETIVQEFDSTIDYSERIGVQVIANRPVLICGSLASLPQLDAMLANLLGRSVSVWQYGSKERPLGLQDAWAGDSDRAAAISLARLCFDQTYASTPSSGA